VVDKMAEPSVQNAPEQRSAPWQVGFDPEGFAAYEKPPAWIAGGVFPKGA